VIVFSGKSLHLVAFLFFSASNLLAFTRDAAQSAVLPWQVVSAPLSVHDVDVSRSHRLEFFENNFTVSLHDVFALYRPQHHRSTPKETPRNFTGIGVGCGKTWLRRTKALNNIFETRKDTSKVTIEDQ